MTTRSVALAGLLTLAVGNLGAWAEDHFLVIGGGYSPEGNQVSLEKNVHLFRALLGEYYPSGTSLEVFFSDGDDPGRDLRYRVPEETLPKANLLLARVLRQTDALGESYRSNDLTDVRGASNRANLDHWFTEEGQRLKPGDRLLIYVTAHGGHGSKSDPSNTVLYLWNNDELRVKELAGLLDRLPRGVRVVLVMVQCYSGGFAELAFQGGDPRQGASSRDICGFFATTQDRPAAGCTPDIDEENYHEYSSYFWEALRGRRRTGEPIQRNPDLDGDGTVSFAEAHAYTLVESITIDIPVKTSETFLRRVGRTNGYGLLTTDSPYAILLANASPIDRAVLEGLSRALQLKDPNRAAEARRKAESAQAAQRRLEREARDLSRQIGRAARPIQSSLYARWPELRNRWNPRVTELLTTEADAVVEAITSHPGFDRFEQLRARQARAEEEALDQERVWVKCQRLLRALENVALAANLPRVSDPSTLAHYRRLLASESQGLGPLPDGGIVAASRSER